MSEIVKVVRPVHAEGEYVIMYKSDMIEGDKLFDAPVEAPVVVAEVAKPATRSR